MTLRPLPERLHRWAVSPQEAMAIQARLRVWVRQEWQPPAAGVRRVAGIDVGVKKEVSRAAVVVPSYPALELLEVALAEAPTSFPYVPGLLSFREAEVVLAALARLNLEPDLLVFDGQGVAHPRRLGIAAHVGVLLDRPTVGCAKSRLWGAHREPGQAKGDYALLYDGDEVIGAVVHTRRGIRPVYVSVGHRIDLARSIDYVLGCCSRYRLPEPIRLAHRAASRQPSFVITRGGGES
ncbi:MAG: deoxyribonuclease V [Chloroflexota bacterium]